MARRRTKRRTHSRRRRHSRMSGTGGMIQTLLIGTAGALVAKVVSNKLSSKVNPKLLAGGEVILGVALPKFVKNKFMADFGYGMAIGGALNGLQSFGVVSAISGIGADIEVSYGEVEDDIAGTSSNLNEVSGGMDYEIGLTDPGIMAGDDHLATVAGYEDMDY